MASPATFGAVCPVCQTTPTAPWQVCERHFVCYACLWQMLTVGGRWQILNLTDVRFFSKCPLCRPREDTLSVNCPAPGQARLQGARRIPDAFVEFAFPITAAYACPFEGCDVTKSMNDLCAHVDECPQRPLVCRRRGCSARVTVGQGMAQHLSDCTHIRCRRCPFRGSRDAVRTHEGLHDSLTVLSHRLFSMHRFARNFTLFESNVDEAALQRQVDAFLHTYRDADIVSAMTGGGGPAAAEARPMGPAEMIEAFADGAGISVERLGEMAGAIFTGMPNADGDGVINASGVDDGSLSFDDSWFPSFSDRLNEVRAAASLASSPSLADSESGLEPPQGSQANEVSSSPQTPGGSGNEE